MKKLNARWGDRVHFVEVLVRQAHPGPQEPPYHSFQQKLEDAYRYQREESIPWTVLADDLQGTTHQVYGGLADPTYLLDADGRVAYYNMWTHAPSLYQAIEKLLAQGGRGTVRGGLIRRPHLGASMTDGWRGLRRGLPQSLTDLELAAPGTGFSTWIGYQLRPLLAPLTLRARPLPTAAKAALLVGGGAALVIGARRLMTRELR